MCESERRKSLFIFCAFVCLKVSSGLFVCAQAITFAGAENVDVCASLWLACGLYVLGTKPMYAPFHFQYEVKP